MIKIEEGRFYKNRDGRKVGPAKFNNEGTKFRWSLNGPWLYQDNGTAGEGRVGQDKHNLISEWQEGPIREVRRREIVPGVYGIVSLGDGAVPKGTVNVHMDRSVRGANAEQLREAAHLFNQLAEVLEESNGQE